MNWMGGQWGRTGVPDASGTGPDVTRNLRLEGSFQGQSISLVGDTEFKSVSGSCPLTVPRGLPKLRCTDLQGVVGENIYQGQGATSADRRLTSSSPMARNKSASPGRCGRFSLVRGERDDRAANGNAWPTFCPLKSWSHGASDLGSRTVRVSRQTKYAHKATAQTMPNMPICRKGRHLPPIIWTA